MTNRNIYVCSSSTYLNLSIFFHVKDWVRTSRHRQGERAIYPMRANLFHIFSDIYFWYTPNNKLLSSLSDVIAD